MRSCALGNCLLLRRMCAVWNTSGANRDLLKEVVNMWWSIGGGIIIFALGMFLFLKPDLIWKLTEEWKSYRADEPSEFYLKTTKIGGITFALFGIIMIMLPVILK